MSVCHDICMCPVLQASHPEIAAIADSVDLSKPTILHSDSSSSGSSSSSSSCSSSSDSDDSSSSQTSAVKKRGPSGDGSGDGATSQRRTAKKR